MIPSTNHPWWSDIGDDAIVIRDKDGDAVCAMPRKNDLQASQDQESTAELLAMAPELFVSLHALLDVMRRSDIELAQSLEFPACTGEEFDVALDDAQALVDLLAEAGVTLGASA